VLRCPGDKTVLGNVMDTVTLYEGCPPCTKKRCPCRGLDHVRLTDAQAALVEGVQFAVVAENDASLSAFERAMADAPGHPCGENNLGVLAWRRGDGAEAVRRFERALEKRPDNACYAANLAGARDRAPDFDPGICLDVNADAAPR
jgi:tetratricopeptide (TPR) repeat protein